MDRKIKGMSTIILVYNMGMMTFGEEEFKEKNDNNIARKNRREQQITKIRKDLRRLRKRFRVAEEGKKAALEEIREGLRTKLKRLRRAERSRKRRTERERQRARFTSNPF